MKRKIDKKYPQKKINHLRIFFAFQPSLFDHLWEVESFKITEFFGCVVVTTKETPKSSSDLEVAKRLVWQSLAIDLQHQITKKTKGWFNGYSRSRELGFNIYYLYWRSSLLVYITKIFIVDLVMSDDHLNFYSVNICWSLCVGICNLFFCSFIVMISLVNFWLCKLKNWYII